MDPVTLIITALSAGAASGSKDLAGNTVSDAYRGLKLLIQRKFADKPSAEVALAEHEKDPTVWEAPLKKALEQSHADEDEKIIEAAQKLIAQAKPEQFAAYTRLANAADATRSQLTHLYEESYSQAKLWSRLSMGAALVGFLVVIIGVLAAFQGYIAAGLITSISSIIPEASAALFFLQAKDANKSVEAIRLKLLDKEEIHRAIELVLTTTDEIQNQLKEVIITRILDLLAKK
jgi:hypothetical protein